MTNKVLITGADGFVGKNCKIGLSKYYDVKCINRNDCDLLHKEAILNLIEEYQPDTILNLAGKVGGIVYNMNYPANMLYENVTIGLNLLDVAQKTGCVKKFIQIGSACSYPRTGNIPFVESELWDGYPEPTNAPYGIAKRTLVAAVEAYSSQYNMCGINLIASNLYGPHDYFDLEKSHVLPALINKIAAAKAANENVTLFGTGNCSREFLYVGDLVEAIHLSIQYDKSTTVNVCSNQEITIKALAELIAEILNFTGEINWDTSKPDGQPRRCLSGELAEKTIGFKANTQLKDGIKQTIEWCKNENLISYSN